MSVPTPQPWAHLGKWGAYVACDGVAPSGQEEGNLCLPSHLRLCDPWLGDSLDWLTLPHAPLPENDFSSVVTDSQPPGPAAWSDTWGTWA